MIKRLHPHAQPSIIKYKGVPTPITVDAVLLPFKDCIITDGLVSVIPVRFGGNYTRSFKEVYMTAKRNGSIIKSIQFTAPEIVPQILGAVFFLSFAVNLTLTTKQRKGDCFTLTQSDDEDDKDDEYDSKIFS